MLLNRECQEQLAWPSPRPDQEDCYGHIHDQRDQSIYKKIFDPLHARRFIHSLELSAPSSPGLQGFGKRGQSSSMEKAATHYSPRRHGPLWMAPRPTECVDPCMAGPLNRVQGSANVAELYGFAGTADSYGLLRLAPTDVEPSGGRSACSDRDLGRRRRVRRGVEDGAGACPYRVRAGHGLRHLLVKSGSRC